MSSAQNLLEVAGAAETLRRVAAIVAGIVEGSHGDSSTVQSASASPSSSTTAAAVALPDAAS
jgi:type II secretory pathway component GspD/PulD (secretin)